MLCVYIGMIVIVLIISTSITLHYYHFFLMVAIIRFQSLSKFDAYNTMVVFICGQNILNRDEANTDDIHSIVFFYVT